MFFSAGAAQWSRASGQTALSPNYEGGLHALVSLKICFFNIPTMLTAQVSLFDRANVQQHYFNINIILL